jgi:hypothetical protein
MQVNTEEKKYCMDPDLSKAAEIISPSFSRTTV